MLGLSYPGNLNFSFLVWIGLVPLFWSLARTQAKFWTGYFAGLVYFLIVFRWCWDFYPLNAVGIASHFFSAIIIFVLYALLVLTMAVFWGSFGYLFSKLSGSGRGAKFAFIAAPALFILLEYARTFGFGLVLAGSGTLFGPYWTMGNFVYSLADNPFILKLSSYIGIYGILFCVVLANYVFYHLLFHRDRGKMSLNKKGAFVIFLIAAIIILSYLYRPQNQPGTKKISYAIVQTDEASAIDQPAKVKLDDFKTELAFLNQIAKQSPKSQLVLFPEASDFLKNISAFLTTAQAEKYFDDLFPDSRLIISGSRVIDTNNKTVSRVFALDTKNGIIGYYDKRLLTPGGEFLPYAFKFALNLSAKGKISAFGQAREFSIGENKKTNFALGGKFTVAPVVCSEIMSPDIVRKNSNGKDVIVAMASMAIYHGAKDNISEVLAVSRFRAAENQKPLLLSANMGLSYAIDGRGVVQKITTDEQPQILTGDMDIGQGKSWYNGYGDWPALIAAGLGVVALIFMNKKHVKSS